jgi:hypothetical protein
VFILSKGGLVTPSLWLSLQNLKTFLWEKKYSSDPPGRYIIGALICGLGQGDEWSHLVIDGAGIKNTKVARRIPETRQ